MTYKTNASWTGFLLPEIARHLTVYCKSTLNPFTGVVHHVPDEVGPTQRRRQQHRQLLRPRVSGSGKIESKTMYRVIRIMTNYYALVLLGGGLVS